MTFCVSRMNHSTPGTWVYYPLKPSWSWHSFHVHHSCLADHPRMGSIWSNSKESSLTTSSFPLFLTHKLRSRFLSPSQPRTPGSRCHRPRRGGHPSPWKVCSHVWWWITAYSEPAKFLCIFPGLLVFYQFVTFSSKLFPTIGAILGAGLVAVFFKSHWNIKKLDDMILQTYQIHPCQCLQWCHRLIDCLDTNVEENLVKETQTF